MSGRWLSRCSARRVRSPFGPNWSRAASTWERRVMRCSRRAGGTAPTAWDRRNENAIAGVTGHVAESVAELLLGEIGWRVLWHFVGPGRHGIDLLFLAPGDVVVAVKVKGTLVGGRVPGLSRRELAQMSAAWIDKADNPGDGRAGP